ncbi:hypothetical protein CGZ75_00475 [Paenibacillus herberti]|uniref:Spore coat protein n=1 Tax=Paenibacillus herberti TaxID=1619309 RepID=A0A229NZG9_9BACL|nr:hypothetical protein CGZ75_00475 [Paenibacillus herberti]
MNNQSARSAYGTPGGQPYAGAPGGYGGQQFGGGQYAQPSYGGAYGGGYDPSVAGRGNGGGGYPPAYRNEAELAAAAYGAGAGAGAGYGVQAAVQEEIPPPGVPGAGYREWYPFRGPHDPCPPIGVKKYVIPPNQYILYQPTGLPQYPLEEALRLGTLWPALYSPYEPGCGRS